MLALGVGWMLLHVVTTADGQAMWESLGSSRRPGEGEDMLMLRVVLIVRRRGDGKGGAMAASIYTQTAPWVNSVTGKRGATTRGQAQASIPAHGLQRATAFTVYGNWGS